MTLQETVTLLYLAKNIYPRDRGLDKTGDELMDMAKVWSELLQDIPFELGKAAVAAHAASNPYAPAVSEIRAYARKLTEPPRLSADEAWAVALGTIRRYGCSPVRDVATGKFPHERARENTPPEVWRVMELMGYRSMCMSENIDVLRAQFIRAWERQEQVRQEREQLLPFLPEAVKEKVLGIGE